MQKRGNTVRDMRGGIRGHRDIRGGGEQRLTLPTTVSFGPSRGVGSPNVAIQEGGASECSTADTGDEKAWIGWGG